MSAIGLTSSKSETPAFEASTFAGPLRQAEVLSNLVEPRVGPTSDSVATGLSFDAVCHPYCIILSQDCDLDWDYRSREGLSQSPESDAKRKLEGKLLASVLFAVVDTADELRSGRPGDLNSKAWRRVVQNDHPRYQFIEAVPQGSDLQSKGVPELGIDFKRYFSLPTAYVYAQVRGHRAQRRCVLTAPYRDHLSQRFGSYFTRIALPKDYESI